MNEPSSHTNQQPVYCMNCGQTILTRARFCRICGAIQEIEGVEVQLVQSIDPTVPAPTTLISSPVPEPVVRSQALAATASNPPHTPVADVQSEPPVVPVVDAISERDGQQALPSTGPQTKIESKSQQLRRKVEISRLKRDRLKKACSPAINYFIILLLFVALGLATLGYQSQLKEADGLRATMTAVAEEASAVAEVEATRTALVQAGYSCTFDQIKQAYEIERKYFGESLMRSSPENLKAMLNDLAWNELGCIIESEGLTIIDAARAYADQNNIYWWPDITGDTLSSLQFHVISTPTPLPTSSIHP